MSYFEKAAAFSMDRFSMEGAVQLYEKIFLLAQELNVSSDRKAHWEAQLGIALLYQNKMGMFLLTYYW